MSFQSSDLPQLFFMRPNRTFTVEELATDEDFRQWTLRATPELDRRWQQWLHANPGQAAVAARARELVLAVHELYRNDLSEDTVRAEIAALTQLAEERKEARMESRMESRLESRLESRMEASNVAWYKRAVWRAAAVLLLTGGLSWSYYTTHQGTVSPDHTQAVRSESEMLVETNRSASEMTVLLSDNSVATLATGSSIRYPRQFSGTERRVYLTGEAFFDVAKNANQPFLVYTAETVTKVLGTSFRIKAFETDNTEMVAVKTGRVSVYPKQDYEMQGGRAGVILNPNQLVVFNRKQNKLEKAVTANPGLLAESAVPKDQVFDDKPVSEAFDALASVYGIRIDYQAELLANCMISAQFGEENLKQRLNAICQAIGAGYDMENGRVVISSKGCN